MLYPRITKNTYGEDMLVDETQCVGYREHLSLKHRILFLTGILTNETEFHNQLLALDTLSHDPIKIVITSPGGELDSTFLFYDTLKMMQSPIITIGRYCASAAVIILVAGSKRYLFPHAKVMLHLATGQAGGDYKDWDIQRRQMMEYQNKVIDILIENGVKKSREEILADIDRQFWLEPAAAIEYGLCDAILTPAIWKEWIK